MIGDDLAGGLDAAAADDDVVLAPQLALDLVERVEHGSLVFGDGEVDEGLVGERRVVRTDSGGGEVGGSHKNPF